MEFTCIYQVLEYAKTNDLNYENVFREVSVVVTVEPCIICASAWINLHVKQIIYGCRNDRFGGCTVLDVPELLDSNVPIRGGVRAEEAMELLKVFYKGENPSAPVPKLVNLVAGYYTKRWVYFSSLGTLYLKRHS